MTASIRGVLLAAGYSKRFGTNKLLHPLPAGRPDAGVPIALAIGALLVYPDTEWVKAVDLARFALH